MRMLIAAAALAASALPALAGEPSRGITCGPKDAVAELLNAGFQEHPVSMALTGGGALAELYRSDEGTWSLVITSPKGESCIIAGGEAWEDIIPGSDA